MFMKPAKYLRNQLCLYRQTASLDSVSIASTRPLGGTGQLHHGRLKSQGNRNDQDLHFTSIEGTSVVPSLYRPSKADPKNGFRGHNLNEERYGLKLETLGEKSEVIVLKESRISFTSPKRFEDSPVPKPVDILAQVDNEIGLPTLTEVAKNIDELRPRESKQLTWEEFQSLQAKLVNGFTVSQLKRYIKSLESLHSKTRELNKQTLCDTLSPILRISDWMSGVSENAVSFDESPLRGYHSEAFTQKQRIVLDILRRHWKLEVLELNEDIGEIEVELRATDLELLINGTSPPLEKLSQILIPSLNENIEVFRSRRIIRITLLKDKCENIVQEILRALRNIYHVEVDIGVLDHGQNLRAERRETIGDKKISELARVTETEITKLSDQKLKISCIHEEPPGLSTRADAARRLILTSSRASDRSVKKLFYDDHPEPLVAVTYQSTDNMPWHYRLREWVRWISPTAKDLMSPARTEKRPQDLTSSWLLESDNEEASAPESARRAMEFIRDLRRPPTQFPSEREPTGPCTEISWPSIKEEECSYPTSIIFGHILHEVQDSQKASVIPITNATVDESIFLPAAPKLSNLLKPWNMIDDRPEDSLVLRFVPSPWTSAGPKALQEFSPVEIRLSVHPDRNPELRDVEAILDSAAINIMLPDKTVDLQLRQRRISQLSPHFHSMYPQIARFIRSSQLDPSKGRIKTPTNLILPVVHMHTDGRYDNSSLNHVEVEYLFAGLEFCRTLTFEFGGLALSYNSIECGKADGRRGELSLHKDTLERGIGEGNGLQILNFIKSAHHLVETLETLLATPEK